MIEPIPPLSSLLLILTGSALLLLDSDRGKRWVPWLILVIASVSLLALLGYLYQIPFLYRGTHRPWSISVHAAVTFLALSVGIMLARPERGWFDILSSASSAGVTARRLIPLAIAIPILLGWGWMGWYRMGAWGIETGLALLVLLNAAFSIGVVWWTARSQHRMEKEREWMEQQERKVIAMAAAAEAERTRAKELEKEVQERRQAEKKLMEVAAQLEAANARLERLSLIDPVTELLNRRGMQQVLSREVAWMRRHHSESVAILMDLDSFKGINDSLGHTVGDVVLKVMGQQITSTIRTTDYLARVGGDEFLVLLPRTTLKEAMLVAEKIRLAVSEAVVALSTGDIRITTSLAVCSIAPDLFTMEDLLNRLYPLLAQCKRMGKNRVLCESTRPMAEEVTDTEKGEMPGSLGKVAKMLQDPANLLVAAQEIVDLETRQVVGYELLSRSKVPGFEMPEAFFRVALESNRLTQLDRRCLEACVQAARLLPKGQRCHINLFPSTLLSLPTESLLEVFCDGLLEKRFCVEISEQQIIGDPSHLVAPVKALKRAGIRIGLDDVGFGRSCLESLILLEPDVLKIDKKWVGGIAQDRVREQALRQLLKIAQTLGIQTIAEGIEAEEDLDWLRAMGVELGQGFLWGKPRILYPADEDRSQQEPQSRGG